MRKKFISYLKILFFLLSSLKISAQEIPPQWIKNMADNLNMEIVYGNNIEYENPIQSYGSYFISGKIHNPKIRNNNLRYVLFLCRKKKEIDSPNPPNWSDFSYHIVFATSNNTIAKLKNEDVSFEVQKVFDVFGPLGMHFLFGNLDHMKLSDFVSFEDRKSKLESNLNIDASWTVPVVLPFAYHNRLILIFYEDQWFMNELEVW